MSKKVEETKKKPVLGRVKNHLKMGIVGLPNVGMNFLRPYDDVYVKGRKREGQGGDGKGN